MRRNTSRRTFLKTVGAIGGAAGVSTIVADQTGTGPIGEADAIAPVALLPYAGVAAASAGAATVGWMLREHEVIGSDDPTEGLTGEVLKQQVYEAAIKRQSNNESTFIDNTNLVEMGFPEALYSEGKLSGIEAINDQMAESDVLASSEEAAKKHATTVKANFLKSWNETVLEYHNLYNAVSEHPDLNVDDIFTNSGRSRDSETFVGEETAQHELPDGTTMDVHRIRFNRSGYSQEHWWDATEVGQNNIYEGTGPSSMTVQGPDGKTATIVNGDAWIEVWNKLDSAQSDVMNGLSTWVTNVYGDVQSGDLNTGDLMSASELAELAPEDNEQFNKAIADLQALNVATDLEREATIRIVEDDVELSGQLATTGGLTVQTGDTIDPSSTSEDYYFTYDTASGEGTWSDYETTVDGGVVTFTAEPLPEVEYYIDTVAGETATVVDDDFTATDSGTWTVDISGQVENAITEVDQVKFFDESTETNYETIRLSKEFEVLSITGSDGTEHDSVQFDRSEPQNDSNYITEEEWQNLREQQEELIEKYENATGGGGFFGGGDGGMLAVGAAALGGGYLLLNDDGDDRRRRSD